MKKIFLGIILVLIISSASYSAEKRILKLGLLTKLNSNENEFSEIWKKNFAPNNENLEIIIRFYDSLNAMQMALNKGDINELVLPEATANYLINQNPEYQAFLVLKSRGRGLSFGFRKDNQELLESFNEAIFNLNADWTLAALEGLYIASAGTEYPKPVEFEKFDNAKTIKVAVTGDLPPIDFITPDGTPAGFNTAVLAEIGRFLKINIELVNIEAGSRAAALASGRADVVFWYEKDTSSENQPDVPEGVILSEPYYEWNKFIHVRKAIKQNSGYNWDLKQSILDLFLSR